MAATMSFYYHNVNISQFIAYIVMNVLDLKNCFKNTLGETHAAVKAMAASE